MPPFASHVEVESYLALADVLRDKGRKHNTVKLKMKTPAEAVEDLPKWLKKNMSQYIAFVENLHSADLYATARLDAACMRPDGYEGNEQGILQSIFESWDLTTHYTQFWIRRWEELHAEAVTHWAKRNAELKQQADKATAVDDGLLDPDGELDLSRVAKPKNVTFNGSGETTEVDLGEGVVVKVPIDKDGKVEGADQFRNNNRFLPLKVLAIRKAIYEAPRNGLNIPKKS